MSFGILEKFFSKFFCGQNRDAFIKIFDNEGEESENISDKLKFPILYSMKFDNIFSSINPILNVMKEIVTKFNTSTENGKKPFLFNIISGKQSLYFLNSDIIAKFAFSVLEFTKSLVKYEGSEKLDLLYQNSLSEDDWLALAKAFCVNIKVVNIKNSFARVYRSESFFFYEPIVVYTDNEKAGILYTEDDTQFFAENEVLRKNAKSLKNQETLQEMEGTIESIKLQSEIVVKEEAKKIERQLSSEFGKTIVPVLKNSCSMLKSLLKTELKDLKSFKKVQKFAEELENFVSKLQENPESYGFTTIELSLLDTDKIKETCEIVKSFDLSEIHVPIEDNKFKKIPEEFKRPSKPVNSKSANVETYKEPQKFECTNCNKTGFANEVFKTCKHYLCANCIKEQCANAKIEEYGIFDPLCPIHNCNSLIPIEIIRIVSPYFEDEKDAYNEIIKKLNKNSEAKENNKILCDECKENVNSKEVYKFSKCEHYICYSCIKKYFFLISSYHIDSWKNQY